MITASEQAFIQEHAYVPEHLPHYVSAISRTEPFLMGDFVIHAARKRLIFVGHPLLGYFDETQMLEALAEAKSRFEPSSVSILAPALPAALGDCMPSTPDAYYRLDLSSMRIPKKVRNMMARARREVVISVGEFAREHKHLVEDFMRTHQLKDAARIIFKRLPEYASSRSVVVFDARTPHGELVAFDVAEFGAQKFAFYMFNFRSRKHVIRGVSDLLLAYIVVRAKTEGKRDLNLGLGFNPGNTFFKRKWGGRPFLKHNACVQESQTGTGLGNLFERFSRS
jgi:hypothetical protein